MMNANLKVDVRRCSFWKAGDAGTIRFVENSPLCVSKHHTCNCTTDTEVRPVGAPFEVQQRITVSRTYGALRMEFELTHLWCTFRWDRHPNDRIQWLEDQESEGSNHAYFIFNPDGNSMQVEVQIPGYGSIDYLLSHVYFGNKVDISKLMNGHSPSRIIRLDEIADTDVWAHDCSFGTEAMARLNPTFILPWGIRSEVEGWKQAMAIAAQAKQVVLQSYGVEHGSPDELRQCVEANEDLLRSISDLGKWLSDIVSAVKSTELF